MSTSPHRPSGGTPSNRSSRWGTLVPVAIVLVGVLEIALLIIIGINTSLWWSVLIVVLGWVVGLALIVAAGQQSFIRLRSLVRAVRGSGDVKDHLSRPAFTMLAALLFFFPGLLTDLMGLVLLVTPVQRRTIRAMGLSSGSESARKVLYRRNDGGVIDGEIIVENRPTSTDTPPTLQQD